MARLRPIEDRVQLAQRWSDDWRSVERDVKFLGERIAGLQAAARDIVEPPPHVSSTAVTIFGEPKAMSAVIREWLDRQRLLGLISPEGAAAVERLIGDLG